MALVYILRAGKMQRTNGNADTAHAEDVFLFAGIVRRRHVFNLPYDLVLAQEELQSTSDRLGNIPRIWRAAVEERYFPADCGREFVISKPDEIVEDDERFSTPGLFDLECDCSLIAVWMKLVAELLDEAAIHQTLRRGIDRGYVYALSEL